MSNNYDNWERLVEVVLRREKDREVALADSRESSFRSTSSRSRFRPSSSFHEQNSLGDSRKLSFRSISSSSRFRPDSSVREQNPQLEAYNSNTVNLLGDKMLSWVRVGMHKWFNVTTNNLDYSADIDSDSDSDSNPEVLPRIRRKSETFRTRYINTKEIRICASTWNVGGRVPPDDLDLDGWLDVDDPAHVYVIGLQDIIPLNAGNIFGAEDRRRVSIWENRIRRTLKKILPATKFRCYNYPPPPSRFKTSEDAPYIDESSQTDSDIEEEICPLNEELNFVNEENVVDLDASVSIDKHNLGISVDKELQRQFYSPITLDRSNRIRAEDSVENVALPRTQYINKLPRKLSGTERIGLSLPEPPLHLLGQHVFERTNSFKSFKAYKSFRTYSSFESNMASLAKFDLKSPKNRKKRSTYVKIVSKQMVGIFLTIWVRRSMRKLIQNLNVSSVGVGVGVGAMGYIGNKVRRMLMQPKESLMSKKYIDGRALIHFPVLDFLKAILDHEKIIWLGDLNYRINLSYEKTRELILKEDWANLVEHDQLIRELRKGRAFDGWSEGTLNFAPTYKYQTNSDTYCGEDSRTRRRTPAWCDRILSFGKGMKLLSYKRSELRLSNHRPVTASYMVEVQRHSLSLMQKKRLN